MRTREQAMEAPIPTFERKVEVEQRDRRVMGWKNVTSWLDKVQDVELSTASGEDRKFVSIHHDVRTLLDAQDKLGSKIEPLSFVDLYAFLKNGQKQIYVQEKDKFGRLTGHQYDLYSCAHLERIKEANSLLGPDALKKEELEKRFWEGGSLSVSVNKREIGTGKNKGESESIDLLKVPTALRPYVSAEDFAYYFNVTQENQLGLQMLGSLRDDSIKIHHAENSGHAQVKEVESGKWIYVPAGVISAANYARGDVKKTTESFRAAGHVHEIGWYEENTSALIKIEADAYKIWRGAIGTSRTHEQTNNRMIDNCLALGSGEHRNADGNEKSYHFGADGAGKIYEAMRFTYDRVMKETRGYGITNPEIGDKIVTDIVGVAFAINPRDWLMSFAAGTGLYQRQDIIHPKMIEDQKGEEKPVFIFDAKCLAGVSEYNKSTVFPADSGDPRITYGKIKIKGIPALTNYLQWRISMGDIVGIDPNTQLVVTGTIPKAEDEEGGVVEEEEKDLEEQTEASVGNWVVSLKGIFGEKAKEYAYILKENKSKKAKRTKSSIKVQTVGVDGKPAEEDVVIDNIDNLQAFVARRIKDGGAEIGVAILALVEKAEPLAAAGAWVQAIGKIKGKDIQRIIKALD